jgi:hypothetical protein
VREGIWRVAPASFRPGSAAQFNPGVQLISPALHYDAALFGQIRIRFRVVNSRPVEGYFSVKRKMAAEDAPLYLVSEKKVFTTDWQEITLSELGNASKQVKWEGELVDIRFDFSSAEASDMPEAIEIDSIVLTGVEEQLQGELPPPLVFDEVGVGEFFDLPAFSWLKEEGIGSRWGSDFALGDLDGDGDLDMAALWEDESAKGWLTALNEGTGRFDHPHVETLAKGGAIPSLDGADLNGDGRIDLAVSEAANLRLLLNTDAGWVELQKFSNVFLLGLADLDGDGDVDGCLQDYSQRNALLLLNDGRGEFGQQRRIGAPTRDFSPAFLLPPPLPPGKTAGIVWEPPRATDKYPYINPKQGYELTYLDKSGAIEQLHLAIESPRIEIRYVGDVDGDGDIDAVVSDPPTLGKEGNPVFFGDIKLGGLTLLRNSGQGTFERLPWDKEAVLQLVGGIIFQDLNGDHLLDAVYVQSSERETAVVVSAGTAEGGLPLLEGHYPLAGKGGSIRLGDMDNDGDLDLVLLEPASPEGSGVQALFNRLGPQITAVAEVPDRLPGIFSLGANYPNPFNPQTWIPFSVPVSTTQGRLQVYNTLGQPVRTLVEGQLVPGYQVVLWDGLDSRGKEVSSGLYFYRLEAGEWRATGKMVKSE